MISITPKLTSPPLSLKRAQSYCTMKLQGSTDISMEVDVRTRFTPLHILTWERTLLHLLLLRTLELWESLLLHMLLLLLIHLLQLFTLQLGLRIQISR